MRRVVVVGTSCAGKTTLARQIAETFGVQHIELDAIHWLPDWNVRPTEEFRTLTSEALTPDCWVVDGNYSVVRDIVWGKATTLVWLNYPFPVVLWRALSRTVLRAITRKELFSGNRESFRQSFMSRDSILWWVATTHHRRRREYRRIFDNGEFTNIDLIELRAPREADELLRSLAELAERKAAN